MPTRSNSAIVDIIKQGPRLAREALEATPCVNEAYLMVHGALARTLTSGRHTTETGHRIALSS